MLSSHWSRHVSIACLTVLLDTGSSLDCLPWAHSALYHPRVLVWPGFDGDRVHTTKSAFLHCDFAPRGPGQRGQLGRCGYMFSWEW
jgi:hypothetical protein